MRSHLKFAILLFSLLTAGRVSAVQPASAPDNGKRMPGINLSLWRNIATQRTDIVGSTFLNIGIFSAQNRLNGLGINALSSIVQRDMNGVQAAGIYNLNGGSMKGVQAAGICNVNGDDMRGISLSGLVGITGNNARGISTSGLINITGDRNYGLLVGGLLNITGDNSCGVHLAGWSNIRGNNFSGVSFSGVLDITGDNLNGLQLTGGLNICGDDMNGVQLSCLGNVTGGTARGLQLSLFNMANEVKGVQIGLVNYYKKSMKGVQLGLVNANPDTQVQWMFFGGNATKVNVAARFKNELFYTILGGGTHYMDFDDKFSASFCYRAGMELPLCKRLFISGDLGFQHIELFKNSDNGTPLRVYALQARVNLEYHLTSRLGIFATGGYGKSRYYCKDKTFDKGAIVEAGVVILK